MNFLSLRVESDDSLVRSYPQKEIQMGAEQVERYFAEEMPATYAAFVKGGRVAP
jgi:thymidylate synthase (FAD)